MPRFKLIGWKISQVYEFVSAASSVKLEKYGSFGKFTKVTSLRQLHLQFSWKCTDALENFPMLRVCVSCIFSSVGNVRKLWKISKSYEFASAASSVQLEITEVFGRS